MSTIAASGPSSAPSPTIEIECKKICVLRCLYAVGYSIAMQFLLLTLFLLFVNFSILHPISWITSTFSLIFSIYTWLCIMPLISLIIIYGIYLGKTYLSEKVTYKRRIVAFYKTTVPKTLFWLLHVSIGFLTTWFYSRFLSNDNQRLLLAPLDCIADGNDEFGLPSVCFNERYLLLTLYGVSVAAIYYLKRFPSVTLCDFPLIHQSKYLKIRSYIYSILWKSLLRTFLPVLVTYAAYTFIGRYTFEWSLSFIFNSNLRFNNSIHIYDIKLLLHIWIISAHILSNMTLMSYLFRIFLSEPKAFPIETNSVVDGSSFAQQQVREVTLVEALANTKVPIVRQLAALDLYNLATSVELRARRQQIYTLSIPGGHPYNWNALSSQCLSLINLYNAELSSSISCITHSQSISKQLNNNQTIGGYPVTLRRPFASPITSPGGYATSPKSATEMADKIRQRQYNESTGMRNMMSPPRVYGSPSNDHVSAPRQPVIDPCARFNETIGLVGQHFAAFKQAVLQTPGIHFLFAECETAHLQSLLSPTKTQEIAWIVQGIAAITAHSLQEDRFGVVQTNLPALIQSLLRLKVTIDKIPTLNGTGISLVETHQPTNQSQRQQNSALFIRNAVKRSLYDICITFADYLPDLVTDADDLKLVQCFINFKEA